MIPGKYDRDVVILGGGLAGLTLALHLKIKLPALSVTVLERRRHPPRAAAHKVGESTVELASHYLTETLGLGEHLDAAHIRKFDLRYFFSDRRSDIENVFELGARRRDVLTSPSFQLDRGILETFLAQEAVRRGCEFIDDATVRSFTIAEGEDAHAVRFRNGSGDSTINARWLIDASGRAGLLRRQMELTRANDHSAHAVWFRLDASLDIDDWTADADWRQRVPSSARWRSTNHFMGPGYWTWLIPLSSGAQSVGIVCDSSLHALDEMRSFDMAVKWLGERQPALERAIVSKNRAPLDFSFLRNYSYGTERAFSSDRWALTGEAAVFTDPFYSPGSDFIAIANTYIVSLVRHDYEGRDIARHTQTYNRSFLRLYETSLKVFEGQYRNFGDPEALTAKSLWDGCYYWGILCQLALNNRLTDLALLGFLEPLLQEASSLNATMQGLFRTWGARDSGRDQRQMLDRFDLDWWNALHQSLKDRVGTADLISRIRKNSELLKWLAQDLSGRRMDPRRAADGWPSEFCPGSV